MSPLRWLWLGLALAGALCPWLILGRWPGAGDPDFFRLLALGSAETAERALAVNLALTSAALSLFCLAEVLVRRNWEALLAIPASFLLGPACGLPLYLFLRAAPIR